MGFTLYTYLDLMVWADNLSSDFFLKPYKNIVEHFQLSVSSTSQFAHPDWDVILRKMRDYNKLRFPDDNRIVTLCEYTPRGTLKVEWE